MEAFRLLADIATFQEAMTCLGQCRLLPEGSASLPFHADAHAHDHTDISLYGLYDWHWPLSFPFSWLPLVVLDSCLFFFSRQSPFGAASPPARGTPPRRLLDKVQASLRVEDVSAKLFVAGRALGFPFPCRHVQSCMPI